MRAATQDDIPRILAMARAFYAYNAPAWPWSPEDVASTIGALIESPAGYVAVTDDGFIAGAIQPHPISRQWLIAGEFLWWAKRSGPRLLGGFREWAKSQGAMEIQYSCPHSEKKVRRYFGTFSDPLEVVYRESA